MNQNAIWAACSFRSAMVRKVIPDIDVTLRLDNDLLFRASVKKHLRLFKPSVLREEIEVARCLMSYISAGGTIYDIGANIGLYTLLFAKNPRRQVISFEPYDIALKYLRRNLKINDLQNVDIHPVILSDFSGECRFTFDEITTSTSHVSMSNEVGQLMTCADLDTYQAKYELPPPALIKMDVEGHDLPVLKGMRTLLSEHKPFVYLEGGLRNDETGEIDAIRFLRSIGYEIWDLDRRHQLDANTMEYCFLAVGKK